MEGGSGAPGLTPQANPRLHMPAAELGIHRGRGREKRVRAPGQGSGPGPGVAAQAATGEPQTLRKRWLH